MGLRNSITAVAAYRQLSLPMDLPIREAAPYGPQSLRRLHVPWHSHQPLTDRQWERGHRRFWAYASRSGGRPCVWVTIRRLSTVRAGGAHADNDLVEANVLLASVQASSMDGTLRHVRDWQGWDYVTPVACLGPPDNLVPTRSGSAPPTYPALPLARCSDKREKAVTIRTSEGTVFHHPVDTLRSVRARLGRPFVMVRVGRVIADSPDEDVLLDDLSGPYQLFFCS